MNNNNCCCIPTGLIIAMAQTLSAILTAVENITPDMSSVQNIERMLAHNNPMTIAAEFPTVMGDRFVVSTPVRFLDMLNTDLYIIFKIDNNNINLPVYFKDAIDYEHPIVLSDATPVLCNQLLLNGIYKATYQYSGSYIILDSLTPLNPDIIPIPVTVEETVKEVSIPVSKKLKKK